MCKIREVLRLHSLGLKQRQIARACAIVQSTVSDYIKQAETAGLTWAEIADWDDDRLLARLSPVATPALPKDLGRLPQPDYAGIFCDPCSRASHECGLCYLPADTEYEQMFGYVQSLCYGQFCAETFAQPRRPQRISRCADRFRLCCDGSSQRQLSDSPARHGLACSTA